MSSEDICREVSIVGGTYQEACYWPAKNELYGSGWRAVRVFRTLCPDATISFHTAGDGEVEKLLKIYSRSENLIVTIAALSKRVGFYYNHPLANPVIYNEGIEPLHLSVDGKKVIVFGMLEATVRVEGEWVVYDPQSPNNPISFKQIGGKANHLALVLNEHEAKQLSGKDDMFAIRDVLFENEGCECLVVKRGAKGAIVFASNDDEGTRIPVFKTSHVWPIGSGDVFTTVFSYCWFSGRLPVDAAMKASKAVAAYCDCAGEIDIISDLIETGKYEEFVPQKKGMVYLAGPFFTLNEKLFVSECRRLLLAMGVGVFSPYHDVGEGEAGDVAPKDIEKLKDCSCVFAIVDGLDSGTLFEIGYAVAMGIKVVAYVENESDGALKMLAGTGCTIEKDFTTAIYKTCWYAAE